MRTTAKESGAAEDLNLLWTAAEARLVEKTKPQMNTDTKVIRSFVTSLLHSAQNIRGCPSDGHVRVVETIADFLCDELAIVNIGIGYVTESQRNESCSSARIGGVVKQREHCLGTSFASRRHCLQRVKSSIRVFRVQHHIRQLWNRWRGIRSEYFEYAQRLPCAVFFFAHQSYQFVIGTNRSRHESLNVIDRGGLFVTDPLNEGWKRSWSHFTQSLRRFARASYLWFVCFEGDFVRVRVGLHPLRKNAVFVCRFVVGDAQRDYRRDSSSDKDCSDKRPPSFHAHRVGRRFQ